ncbi:hypothetical protein, partial [Brevibacillus laterosporus]|uniref:hypothetical protein n=1 Tax=Brevibacillus laterosporus TaxID=1465 RepID=UPI001A7E96BF
DSLAPQHSASFQLIFIYHKKLTLSLMALGLIPLYQSTRCFYMYQDRKKLQKILTLLLSTIERSPTAP